ncbi:Fe-S-cluster-containing dehydrogenase component [Desulfobaculum xiamenense]|uniref:Fe-S-cluster-containing dehydrogenase component n=1 Tax=Desulfobaculum xiamenense TaxID=995050 RepID=A0A846QTE0_9BACT|nr:4Fe-4S dicluster domain-containing protein [Desulfobaculum xiamenense]NJB68444.1 Fe-S-cluster-containing dehydrogenase component [Desulfobaculum xiamenense]
MKNSRNETPKTGEKGLSRRGFLLTAGRAAGGFAAGLVYLKSTGSLAFAARPGGDEAQLPGPMYELRFDTAKCAGCAYCEIACAQFHEGHADPTSHRNSFTMKPVLDFIGVSALSANAPGWPQPLARATFAEFSENEFCRQCESPECLDACPENAIFVDPKTGARVVDEKKCVGCGTCAEACQYGMIHVSEATGTAIKCDLCGGDPQCVAWCPTQAITFHKL